MKEVIVKNTLVSIGIDVDKDKSVIAAYSPIQGEFLIRGNIPHNLSSWKRFLSRFPDCRIKAYYEASCTGFWLYRTLLDLGVECHVVNPSSIPKESDLRQRKTDNLDARTLSQLCVMPPRRFVRVPTRQEEQDRELPRTREQLVKHRIRVINQIKSKLLFHHISYDFPSRSGTKDWIESVRNAVTNNQLLKISLGVLLDLLSCLNEQIKVIEKALRTLSKEERYANIFKRLKQVPGVGPITAMTFLIEVFRPSDFKSPKQLHSHLGLVPTEWSSGGTVRHGHLTRWGPAHLRRLLIEAAWVWVRLDPEASKVYQEICRGRLRKKSIVAMARRLATVLWAMTTKSEDYNFHWKKAA